MMGKRQLDQGPLFYRKLVESSVSFGTSVLRGSGEHLEHD